MSLVITSLLILVASVVLASGYVTFSSSIFKTHSQQDSLAIYGMHVWLNSTDPNSATWGAIGIRNDGERIIGLNIIQVKGINVPTSNWYVDKDQTRVTSQNFLTDYSYTGTNSLGILQDTVDAGGIVTTSCDVTSYPDISTLEIDFDDSGVLPTLCLLNTGSPSTIKPSEEIIVYFQIPSGIIESFDAGRAVSVSIYADEVGMTKAISIENMQ